MLGKRYSREPKLKVVEGLSIESCHQRYTALLEAAKVRLQEELDRAAKRTPLTCKACNDVFYHESVGRPRSFCPKCYSGPGKKEYEKAYQRGYYARRKEGLSGYEAGMD